MRVLIVDDERPARERLGTLLAAFPDLEVIGECEDGEDALQRIGEMHPDLVMLDVQMRGSSGIEVAGSHPAPRPKIIFCTAYNTPLMRSSLARWDYFAQTRQPQPAGQGHRAGASLEF